MPSTSRLLPEHIVCKITQRDNIRRANPCDPALKPLNLEITSDISLHKQNLWKEHLNANWDHRHNTHTLWKTTGASPGFGRGGGKNFFFEILEFACREAMCIARGVWGHAPPRKFFKTVQFGAF